jgi:putative transcriptional regulator
VILQDALGSAPLHRLRLLSSNCSLGTQDAVAYLNGDKSRGRATVIDVEQLDVSAIRDKVGPAQDDFANAFGVSVGTLRNWEQGRNRPDGPARALLTVIDRDPGAVLKALRIAPTPRKSAPLLGRNSSKCEDSTRELIDPILERRFKVILRKPLTFRRPVKRCFVT